ncbi:MAG: XRE family transcriptional regulator [Myxococcaceae bacterium]|nr:MAG: XRE family transcriptional regulator [Myxococcaceae bacterium]
MFKVKYCLWRQKAVSDRPRVASRGTKRGARHRSVGYAGTVERVAVNVRRLREARGWTQNEVASRADGMSERLYRLVESGRTNVTASTMTRLADAFGVDVVELLAPIQPTSAEATATATTASPDLTPYTAASLLLDPRTLWEPSVVQALEGVRQARRLDALRSVGTDVEEENLPPVRMALVDAMLAPRKRYLDTLRLDDGEQGQRSRVSAAAVAMPTVPADADIRRFLLALLVANPNGLLTGEMAEAVERTGRRPRKNEVHEVMRALRQAGSVVREGRRAAYVYRLRDVPPNSAR